MNPLTADEIRASFVNCSKGEAKRALLPADLDETPWPQLDFLGWPDPSGSQRAYLVLERDGAAVGLLLRQTGGGGARSTMCQVCVTPHSGNGVALSVARKTGAAGKRGDSTGIYVCRNLACSLYVRGKRVSGAARLRETISEDLAIERLRRNLDQFVDRVLTP